MLTAYPPELFNTQRLLFDHTRRASDVDPVDVPEQFYERGWVVVDGVADHEQAAAIQEGLIAGIDTGRLPSHGNFGERVQLGKADLIPVCDDVVATSYQVLHFDMGLPLAEGPDEQLLVSHVGIYLPADTAHEVTARTRLLELGGVLEASSLDAGEVEARLLDYALRHGDGWEDHNTRRLACFVRVIDALLGSGELTEQIDKTVGQWFVSGQRLDSGDAHAQECDYFLRHGLDLSAREHEVALEPGQLLFVDNTRVVHGRIGKRRAREIFNFMFGVPAIDNDDIALLRRGLCELMVG
jgi:hypothetical protein